MGVFRLERVQKRPRQAVEQADHGFSSGNRATSVDLVGKRPRPAHRRNRQRGVEMRKQIAAARWFPFERRAERIAIDRDQHQIGLSGEMLRRGFGKPAPRSKNG